MRVEKVIKRKVDKLYENYMSNGKVMIILFTVGLREKLLLYKMSYFLKPYTRSENKVKVALDLPNYIKNFIKKNQQVLIHQNLLKKANLVSIKSDADELDIDKLRTAFVH